MSPCWQMTPLGAVGRAYAPAQDQATVTSQLSTVRTNGFANMDLLLPFESPSLTSSFCWARKYKRLCLSVPV